MRLQCIFLLLLSLFAYTASAQSPTDLKRARESFNQAQVNFALQEYEKALADYKEAYRLSQAPDILGDIASCYLKLKRYEEALSSYHALLRALPDVPNRGEIELLITESESKLAERHFQGGKYQEALALYENIAKRDSPPELHLSLAECYQRLGRLEEALSNYRAFLAKAPNHTKAPEAQKAAEEIERKLAPSLVAPTTEPVSSPTTSPATQASTTQATQEDQLTPSGPETQPAKHADTHLPRPAFFYAGAGGLAALSIAAGGLAYATALKSEELSNQGGRDAGEVQRRVTQAKQLALLSDGLLAASVLSGGLGIFFTVKRKSEASLSLSPQGASLLLHF